MIISNELSVTLLFDLSELDKGMYGHTLVNDRVSHIAAWKSDLSAELVYQNYFLRPVYQSDKYVIRLNHTHWLELQLMKHLPTDAIIQYFTKRLN